MAAGKRWSESEVKQALYLYFQLPFGKLHSGNYEIIALANALGRTPSSVAMKLANFASLDPAITASGRKGLEGASALDQKVWGEFHDDWTRLIVDTANSYELGHTSSKNGVHETVMAFNYTPITGETTKRIEIEQRVGQNFFRRAVLANYNNCCCVTGIADTRLLNASHISPWQNDIANRHNPRNGLSLSATFDRAFDRNLMTVTPDFVVRLSSQILGSDNMETRAFFGPYEGQKLRMPTHLMPDRLLLRDHSDRLLP